MKLIETKDHPAYVLMDGMTMVAKLKWRPALNGWWLERFDGIPWEHSRNRLLPVVDIHFVPNIPLENGLQLIRSLIDAE